MEHCMSCNRIVYTFGWLFLCFVLYASVYLTEAAWLAPLSMRRDTFSKALDKPFDTNLLRSFLSWPPPPLVCSSRLEELWHVTALTITLTSHSYIHIYISVPLYAQHNRWPVPFKHDAPWQLHSPVPQENMKAWVVQRNETLKTASQFQCKNAFT